MKVLKKSNKKIITGVCGGIAETLKCDPTIIRLVAVILILITKGIGLVLYVVAAIVMPEADSVSDDDIENMKSANMDEEEFKKSSEEDVHFESKESGNAPHTNEEFNEFFKK